MSEELNKLKQEIIAESSGSFTSIQAKDQLLNTLLDTLIIKSKSEALDEKTNS